MMDALWPLGYLPGMALSSVIRSNLGFMPTFAFGMMTALLAMTYSIFVLKDSRVLRAKRLQKEQGKADAQLPNALKLEPISEEQPPPPYETLAQPANEGLCQVCTSFFDIRDELYKNRSSRKTDFQKEKKSTGSPILLKIVSENRFSGKPYFCTIASRNLKLGIKAVFKKREGNKRAKIMLIIALFQLSMLSSFGQHAVLYLYFRRQLAWTHKEYTLYSTIGGLVGGVSQTTVIPLLTSKLQGPDSI